MRRRDWQLRRNREGTKNDELRIQQHLGSRHTRWRYLGDYQYSPKLRVEREEIDLDSRCGAAAGVGLNPLVFSRATGSQGVTWQFALGCYLSLSTPPVDFSFAHGVRPSSTLGWDPLRTIVAISIRLIALMQRVRYGASPALFIKARAESP